jgi:hypothetical protein
MGGIKMEITIETSFDEGVIVPNHIPKQSSLKPRFGINKFGGHVINGGKWLDLKMVII